MKYFVSLLIAACFILPVLSQGKTPEVKVWLVPSTCMPGDVVELHAELQSSEFTEFTLQLPNHDSLHFVNQYSLPVSYQDGIYTQKSTWQLQPLDSGNIELNGIIVITQQGNETSEQVIGPQSLSVNAYTINEDSAEPLMLPAHSSTVLTTSNTYFRLIIILVCILSPALWFLNRRQSDIHSPSEHLAESTMADLECALQAGDTPKSLIETILCNSNVQLTIDQRSELERVAYNRNYQTTPEALLQVLRKEANG